MLTRHDVLNQLKILGVKELSLLRNYLRDYEKYMEINYGLRIAKTQKQMKGVLENQTFERKTHPNGAKTIY
jgi:hypothetical protein